MLPCLSTQCWKAKILFQQKNWVIYWIQSLFKQYFIRYCLTLIALDELCYNNFGSTSTFPYKFFLCITERLSVHIYFTYRVLIKYCVFFQEFSKVCHLFVASTRQKKLPANSYDCTLALHLKVSYSNVGARGVTVKNTFLPEHPVFKTN